MADSRLTKLADVLVNYSTAVRPGNRIVIGAEAMAAPLVREVFADGDLFYKDGQFVV